VILVVVSDNSLFFIPLYERTNKNEGERTEVRREPVYLQDFRVRREVYSGLDLVLRVAVVPSRKLRSIQIVDESNSTDREREKENMYPFLNRRETPLR